MAIPKVVHEALRKICNYRLELFASVWLFDVVILVESDYNKTYHYCDKRAEVSEIAKTLRRNVDKVMASELKVLHFVNEGGTFADQVQNFVGVALSVDVHCELVDGALSQEMAYWVDRKVNCHNLVVFYNLHISCVSLEKLVYVRA